MADTKAKVTVMTHDGKKVHAIIPTNVTAGKLLPHLVKKLDLAADSPGGERMAYDICAQTADGTVQLQGPDVLHDAGVVDGTTLRITPVMTAGNLAGEP